MKKILTLVLLSVCSLCLAQRNGPFYSPNAATATTATNLTPFAALVYHTNGTMTSYPTTGTPSNNWTQANIAITNSLPGEKVMLASGYYMATNPIYIPSGVTVSGQGIGTHVDITSAGFGADGAFVMSNCTATVLENLYFTHTNGSTTFGVNFDNVTNCVLRNMRALSTYDLTQELGNIVNLLVDGCGETWIIDYDCFNTAAVGVGGQITIQNLNIVGTNFMGAQGSSARCLFIPRLNSYIRGCKLQIAANEDSIMTTGNTSDSQNGYAPQYMNVYLNGCTLDATNQMVFRNYDPWQTNGNMVYPPQNFANITISGCTYLNGGTNYGTVYQDFGNGLTATTTNLVPVMFPTNLYLTGCSIGAINGKYTNMPQVQVGSFNNLLTVVAVYTNVLGGGYSVRLNNATDITDSGGYWYPPMWAVQDPTFTGPYAGGAKGIQSSSPPPPFEIVCELNNGSGTPPVITLETNGTRALPNYVPVMSGYFNGNGSGLTNFQGWATNTIPVSATGVTNNTAFEYLVSITAGTAMAMKDNNGNQFLVPILGSAYPLKPGWRLTGTAVTATCTIFP